MITSTILPVVIGALGTLACFAVAVTQHIKGKRQAERDMANVRRWRLKQRLVTSKATDEARTRVRLAENATKAGITPFGHVITAQRHLAEMQRDAHVFNVYGG